MFRMTECSIIMQPVYVMLSEVEASTRWQCTIHRHSEGAQRPWESPRWLYTINAGCRLSASRRFFTKVQNDNTWRDTIRCHAERSRSIPSLAMRHQPSFRGSIATVGIPSLATHYQRRLSMVGSEEILHSVQNDIPTPRDPISRQSVRRNAHQPRDLISRQSGLGLAYRKRRSPRDSTNSTARGVLLQ